MFLVIHSFIPAASLLASSRTTYLHLMEFLYFSQSPTVRSHHQRACELHPASWMNSGTPLCLTRQAYRSLRQFDPHSVYRAYAVLRGEGTSTAPNTVDAQIRSHIQRRQPALAFKTFEARLANSSARDLERSILLFDDNGIADKQSWILRAYQAFRHANHTPTVRLLERLLRLFPGHIMDDGVMQGQKTAEWFKDERAVVAMMKAQAKLSGPQSVEEIFILYERYLADMDGGRLPGPQIWATLIQARGMRGDLKGAEAWFRVWRLSKEHPCMLDGAFTPAIQEASSVARREVLHRPVEQAVGFLSPYFSKSRTSGKLRLADFPRRAHTLANAPLPNPSPYLALLRCVIEQSHRRHPSVLDMIHFMVADQVQLTSTVLNLWMDVEWRRREGAWRDSTLAIYDRMRQSSDQTCQPDKVTYLRVLRAYGYDALSAPEGRPYVPPLCRPTQLASKIGHSNPPSDLMQNPRSVVIDMISNARTVSGLDTNLLNNALHAFVRSQDFEGAAAMLPLFGQYKIRANSATHTGVVSTLTHMHALGLAFTTLPGHAWFDSEQREAVDERMKQLELLDEPTHFSASDVVSTHSFHIPTAVVDESLGKNDLAHSDSVTTGTASVSPYTWNRKSGQPRKEWELRATRRYEFHDFTQLREILWIASPAYNPRLRDSWDNAVRNVRKTLYPTRNRINAPLAKLPPLHYQPSQNAQEKS